MDGPTSIIELQSIDTSDNNENELIQVPTLSPSELSLKVDINNIELNNNPLYETKSPISPSNNSEFASIFMNKKIMIYLIVASIIPMIYITFYVASMWNPSDHLYKCKVAIINDDIGFNVKSLPDDIQLIANSSISALKLKGLGSAGEMFVNLIKSTKSVSGLMAWSYPIISRSDAIASFDNGDYWAVVYIPPNFSSLILQNVTYATYKDLVAALQTYAAVKLSTTSSSKISNFYNPVEVIFDRGRNYGTVSIVVPVVEKVISSMASAMALQVPALLTSATSNSSALSSYINPLFSVAPFTYFETNLKNVQYYGLNFASSIMVMVMFIGAQITVTLLNKHQFSESVGPSSDSHGCWGFHYLAVKTIVAWSFTAFQAFAVTSILMMSGADLGHGAGMVFIWNTFLGACFLPIHFFFCGLVGVNDFAGLSTLFMLLNFTTCGGSFSEDLMPSFFSVGIGLPFYYGVTGMRYILFDSYNHIGFASGILILYAVGFTFLATRLYWKNLDKQWKDLGIEPADVKFVSSLGKILNY